MDDSFSKISKLREFEPIPSFEIQAITSLCNFLEYFITPEIGGFNASDSAITIRGKLSKYFAFSFIWGVGGSFSAKASRFVDNIMRYNFEKLKIPPSESVFEYYLEPGELKFVPWSVPEFEYDIKSTYFSILVPTIDTVRYSYLLDICIQKSKHLFFTGETGVGKSFIIHKYLSVHSEERQLTPKVLNFSAQTSSRSTQQTIEADLEKKQGRKVLGAPGSNTLVLFFDDVNMPLVEKYGAQPPIELLRQLIESGGFYDRQILEHKRINKFVCVCAAAPPSGGRAALTARFTRHFHMLCLPQSSEETMISIFESIVLGFLTSLPFSDSVRKCGTVVVG